MEPLLNILKIPDFFGKPARRPKVALVLGGGAARGFAHIGVIRVLEQEKIPIDLIVGTSVGSLIGAIYACDVNSFELEWTAFTLEREDLFDYGLLSVFTGLGAAKGDKLEEFVRNKVPVEDITRLKIPFAATATDLNNGTQVILDSGPVDEAVRASCAIPGIFEPVAREGRLLVDGGLLDNLPVQAARDKGSDIVIAVDVSSEVKNDEISNVLEVMVQAIHIMSSDNIKCGRRDADILISPQVGTVGMLDFSKKKECLQAGIEAARMALPEIRRKIAAR